MLSTLAMAPWMTALLVVGFLFVSLLMVLIVLIQRPQGGGLSGAFGSSAAGSSQTAFGAKTGDALTIATIVIFVLFLGAAVGLNYVIRPSEAKAEVPTATAPETAPAGAAPAEATPEPPTPQIERDTAPAPEPAPTEPPAETPAQPEPQAPGAR